jgi:hypothetical protein
MIKNQKAVRSVVTHYVSSDQETLLEFTMPEFLQYSRGPLWYLVAAIVTLGLLIFGILTQSLTFVLALGATLAVYLLTHHHDPAALAVRITEQGVQVGNEFYPYVEIKDFAIFYDPPYLADVKLRLRRRFLHTVTLHLADQEPEAVRQALLRNLPCDTEARESLPDLITRALRL